VIYTYDGWTGPIYFGEEVKNPGRGIPRAMCLGVLAVMAIYLLLNLALLRVLGVERMAGDPFIAATAGKVLFGDRGDLVIRSLVLVSILGGVNALLLMAPRVVLAMGRDRLLPSGFETVNQGGTPTVGHWSSVGVAVAFIVSGTFNTVLAVCAFFFVAGYTLSFLSVFVLRRKEPDTPRPYRVPGYPYTTGIVLVASVAFLLGSIATDWGNSWKSLLLLALSFPVYRLIVAARDRKVAK
jgi:APA family basic amino acid/polyamine antiporter